MSLSSSGDGHRVDPALAEGTLKEFFAQMGPNSEAWQITTDLVDSTNCKPGSYVIVEIGRAPEPMQVVLAELRNGSDSIPIFRVWYGTKLIISSIRPVDSPVLNIDGKNLIVRGPVTAYWP